MMEVGLRVVRGRDWKWENQDGGEGHAGTVVEIGKPATRHEASSANADKTPEKTVIVQWDHGSRSNYRIGYQDAYDLMVFDNAAAGVKHVDIICDGCKSHVIIGIRYKCMQCFDYDLCTKCYMADTHDLNHPFQRYLVPDSVGVELSPRINCTKIQLKGIFIGAKVTRGPDWEWGNQDGGRGNTGTVIDIRGWDNESSRSVATVTWASGSTNVYRLGYKGCMDLCYVEAANGGVYYKEHLPHLGQNPQIVTMTENETPSPASSNLPVSSSYTNFVVGDKVKVLISVETLKGMQNGHGGWNPRMADYIGKLGTVHRITDKGDVRVQYDGCNNRWTYHPAALTKIVKKDTFTVGCMVKLKSDANVVRRYQRGHGEWVDEMRAALGKVGRVMKIYPDGDMRVKISGDIWTFNPLSLVLITDTNEETESNAVDNTDPEVERLLRDAARGSAGIPAVNEFLRKYPQGVDTPGGGRKTCLQVAAHQGQRDLCILLLDAGASLFWVDEDGDTPLHYAAFGNQPDIINLLLSRGANIDAVNNGKCSALHVAVNKQHVECVKTLLHHGCNVNLQDSYGDTTLHDAIGKESLEIIDALCATERLDFTLRNKRGFNVLHHAALKGNAHATQRLVTRARQLVDVKKDDGFAALHLAALNGHPEVTATLISQRVGQAKIDIRNNRGQTPLLLAVAQGHWSVIELLVTNHADITCFDEDGDTPLHVAVFKNRYAAHATAPPVCSQGAPFIHGIWNELARQGVKTELAIACFLVSCDNSRSIYEHARNAKGKTPLDLVMDDPDISMFSEIVRSYKDYRRLRPTSSTSEAPIYQIETNQGDAVNRSRSTICSTCQRRGQTENVDCTNCAQSGLLKARRNDTQSSEEELEKDVEQDKAKNGYSEKNRDDKSDREKEKDLERLRYLETRIADLEEANMCSICMEHRRNVAFLCGHGACEHCAASLKTCHMCRQTITKKINLY